MVEKAIKEVVKKYLAALQKTDMSISFGVIFGSYASGTANQLSDIDLLVVSPEFDDTIPREIVKKLWQIAARVDSRIEPIPCGEAQWRNDQSNAIIEIARLEGQTV